jgi:enoyl-CoA hydratase/carnithine racemase
VRRRIVLDISTMDLATIALSQPEPGIVVATLNRPERMNSQSFQMFDDLAALPLLLRDEEDLRALIITGAGDRAFCAGFDLDEIDRLPTFGVREFIKFQELAAGAMSGIRSLPVPVIAAINGAASGGGMALALAADIRLASPNAKINAAFVKIGLSVGELGVSYTLPRLVGPGRAAEIAYTGRQVFAEEAERIGLFNRVVPLESLLDEAIALGVAITANSPGGVRMSKRALQANLEVTSYAAAMELENRGQALLTRGSDMPEALAAFKAKRQPVFTGQ